MFLVYCFRLLLAVVILYFLSIRQKKERFFLIKDMCVLQISICSNHMTPTASGYFRGLYTLIKYNLNRLTKLFSKCKSSFPLLLRSKLIYFIACTQRHSIFIEITRQYLNIDLNNTKLIATVF